MRLLMFILGRHHAVGSHPCLLIVGQQLLAPPVLPKENYNNPSDDVQAVR